MKCSKIFHFVIFLITEKSLDEPKEARIVFKVIINFIRYVLVTHSGQANCGGT